MVNQVMKDLTFPCHYASADFVTTGHLSWISAQWEIARIRMDQEHSANVLIILDELQKLENWSEQVKKEWDIDTFNGSGLKVGSCSDHHDSFAKGLTDQWQAGLRLFIWNIGHTQKCVKLLMQI
jgi:hypothetical protein